MTIYIVIGALIIVLVAVLMVYNQLVSLRNKANEAFSTMDVFLKKRFDLIPSLVEAVKGYARHEADVLQQVTQLRSQAASGDRRHQLAGESEIGKALQSLFVVVEGYPELKASNSFLTLQQQLSKMEDEISLSRRYYNGSVREYNNHCQLFPLNLVALLFGFRPMPMFTVDSEAERHTVDVSL